ncbi:MAG: protein TolR [Bdellovibrionaceae bacterium]|nr:protein TolR [Pseudobdellovibrionaceae bacterium]|tara:strand:- start:523 stop:957 length:435 start_codon:yes stop_codon:yes gene_type:complete
MMLPPSGSSKHTPTNLAEINVTPLVDVMLVLLIVFMVSAPLMQQGVKVDIPQANTGAMEEGPDQIVVSISKKKEIKIDSQDIEKGTLVEKLSAIAKAKPDIQVVVKADQNLAYRVIAQLIAQIKKANVSRVGLATQPGNSKVDF